MKVLIPYAVADVQLVSSSVAETDYAAWSAVTAYTAGQRVIRTNTHRIYERLLPGTTATAPELDATNWRDIGPTNRWAMFDGAVGTRTTATTSITVQLALGAVNDIVLLGVVGTSVVVTKPGGATVTTPVPAELVSGQGATVKILGLAGISGTIQIALSGTGTVAIGNISLGLFTAICETEYGTGLGLKDFSTKEFDSFGVATLVRRDYSRLITPRLRFPLSSLDQVVRILAAVRSTPVIWMTSDTLSVSVVWAYPTRWSLTVRGTAYVEGSAQLESLALG
jgi:hypothetical protein